MADQAEDDGADLRELQGMAAELEAENAIPAAEDEQPSVSPEMQAYGLARAICELAAKGASMRWDCLSYNDTVKDQGAQVLAPVFLKYDIQSEFLAQWSEEIAAGAFFAGVIFTSYQKIEAEKEEKRKKEAEKEVKANA